MEAVVTPLSITSIYFTHNGRTTASVMLSELHQQSADRDKFLATVTISILMLFSISSGAIIRLGQEQVQLT